MERKVVYFAAPLVWTALCLVTAPAAGADEHPPIVLALDACAEVDAQEVRRLVPIEMGAPVAGEGDPRETTRVSVGCVVDTPQLVRLEVRDASTGKTLDRVITLVGVAKADRARLVAIAAVELVAASRSGAGREPEGAARAVPAAPTPPAAIVVAPAPPPDVGPPPSRWRVLAVGGLRGFAGLPRLLPGAGLAVQRALPRHLAVGGDITVEGAAQPTALGGVDAFLTSASLVGLTRLELGPVTFEPGLGARAGLARLAGQNRTDPLASVSGETVTAGWAGPMAVLRGAVVVGRRLVISLGGEVGYVTAGVVGHVRSEPGEPSHPDVAVSGVWWGATLGVGYAP